MSSAENDIRSLKHKKEIGHSLKLTFQQDFEQIPSSGSSRTGPNLKTRRRTKSLLSHETSNQTVDVTTGTNEQVECQASFQQSTEDEASTSFTRAASKDDQSVGEDDLKQVADNQMTMKKGFRRILNPKILKLPKWAKSSKTGGRKKKMKEKMTEVTGSYDKVGQQENEEGHNLQEKYNVLENINQQLQTENIDMNKRINAFSCEKAQVIERRNANTRIIQQLQEENSKKDNENQQYVDDKRKKDDEIRQLQQEKDLIEKEKQQLQEEKSSMENQIQQLREENIRKNNQIQQHEDDNRKKENDIRQLHLEKGVIEKEKQQLQEEKSSMENQIRQLQEENSKKNNEIQQHVDDNRKKDNDIRQLHQEKDIIKKEKQQLHEEKSSMESQIQRLREEIQEMLSLQKTEFGLITERGTVTVSSDDKILGRGAWATVYTGDFFGTKVAVKEYHEVILSPHNLQILKREIKIASQCRHPNLLQMICGTENENSRLLIVTELMDMTLRTLLEQRANENSRLEPSQVKSISQDVARGLNYLHLKTPNPIIHRDVSSANVLLWIDNGSVRRAKISDYGSANFMHVCKTVNPGAALYAAPEAWGAKQSPKIDVFSYGLLVCEICTCELPSQGGRSHQIKKITNASVKGLVEACTRKDPQKRPAMEDLIEFWKRI